MNRPNHSQQSNPREELVDKLHGTLSTLRRERDELHRSKQLAIERLRLIKEERVTAEDNIRLLNKKYENIISSNAQQERRTEIAKLQREVERLGREAKFQHIELVGKRERMNKLKTRIQEEEIEYSKHLRIAKEALHIRREKVAARQANHATVSNDEIPNVEKIRKLVTENGNGNSIDFFLKMQRLVQKKTAEVVDETNALRVETETAKMIISGYEIYMQKDDVMGGYTRNFTPALQQ